MLFQQNQISHAKRTVRNFRVFSHLQFVFFGPDQWVSCKHIPFGLVLVSHRQIFRHNSPSIFLNEASNPVMFATLISLKSYVGKHSKYQQTVHISAREKMNNMGWPSCHLVGVIWVGRRNSAVNFRNTFW